MSCYLGHIKKICFLYFLKVYFKESLWVYLFTCVGEPEEAKKKGCWVSETGVRGSLNSLNVCAGL